MSKKILIVEDDRSWAESLKKKMRAEGYAVEVAHDGREGFEKVASAKPDLILLDIVLPSMNGFEFLEAKNKDEGLRHIPVIVISSSSDPAGINRALSLGVGDYLIKSELDQQDLAIKIRQQLGDTGDSAPQAEAPLSGKKIMWVEDDKFLSDIISRKLGTQNCTLIHATSGEEALGRIESDMPDIVMLDLMLPGMSGFQILQKIKTNPTVKHIPVILLSNMGQQADIEKGETLGAAKFLIKATVTLDEIVKEIQKTIK